MACILKIKFLNVVVSQFKNLNRVAKCFQVQIYQIFSIVNNILTFLKCDENLNNLMLCIL